MNEEMKVEEMEIVNDRDEVISEDTCVELEESGNGIFGKLVFGAMIAGVGLGVAYLRKNRDKLDELRIKKLERKGYKVSKEDEFEDIYDDDFLEDKISEDISE